MTNGRSREDLIKFIDYLGKKGLIPSSSAATKKASVKKVLAILNDDEANDIMDIDIEQLILRFSNLHGQEYDPKSLNDYRSRLKSSINDFKAYCENPLGFRPSVRTKPKVREDKEKQKLLIATTIVPSVAAYDNSISLTPLRNVSILPISLRPDLTIQIAGLPFDLTQSEAKKIANIILAHVSSE